MSARQTILKLTVIFGVSGMLLFVDANAAVYKWKDENGHYHFTDNPINVPKAYRKNKFLRDYKPQRGQDKKDKEAGVKVEEKKTIKDQPAEAETKGLTEAQRAAAEATLNFLKEDIPRYEKIYTWPASRSKFRLLKQAVAGATPKKQVLLDQMIRHDLPLFKDISQFLKSSIAEDEKSQKILPTTITSTRQTQALMNRLKKETEQEKQLLEKITTILIPK